MKIKVTITTEGGEVLFENSTSDMLEELRKDPAFLNEEVDDSYVEPLDVVSDVTEDFTTWIGIQKVKNNLWD
jgi:hypothetical protein